MKAAIIKGLGEMSVETIETPRVKDGTVLIKVKTCAVCGSDIRIFESGNDRVRYPAVIGHEIAGEVVAVGAGVSQFKRGDRVAVGADVPCGACDWCRHDMGNCCDENYAMGYQFAGGYAEYCLLEPLVVKHGPVALIPDSVSDDEAAIAEPLACCINGLERAQMQPGKTVLIIGSGPIGTLLVALAKAYGAASVAIAERNPQRLDLAKVYQPDQLILSVQEDLRDRVRQLTAGKGMDIVITACANTDAQEEALGLVAKRGVINFFGGLPRGSRQIRIDSNLIHYRECYVTGSHGSVPRQHKLALDLIAGGKIDVRKIISHSFPLELIAEGFKTVKNLAGMKVVIKP
ncbi:MAG: alcohol dehydrogenase catalytic domain-containing protein [Candidatus Margulisbacteria bacterium]|nr:alcohol dehydrogenase catalytic domain-containing protein [Candidatus Margulisiibacteriota bacterium]MBU1617137.1 alcohol dehydrogenase catalytic domain-containing protein [Candidatus Margulisiibacteriota bacterium]